MAAAAEQGMYYAQQQPSAYGAFDGGGQKASGFGSMGSKGSFLRSQRRRLNIQPLFLGIFVPWAVYSLTNGVLSFSLHHESPGLCYLIVGATALVVAGVGLLALSASGRWFANAEHEPTWLIFLFGSMAIAFVAGCLMGSENYSNNMERYFNMKNLNNYTDVYPTRMRGQQLMDAGIIEFTAGTYLDISKSMGFKNNDIYCVAPISKGDTPLATYDFWAVGTNCCAGNQANFHCANFNNPHANGGLRLMTNSDRAFYRLAVQQAEATYNIKAVHPLFFIWDVEPSTIIEGWREAGRSDFLVWMLAYLIFQTFAVAVATLGFAKMGQF